MHERNCEHSLRHCNKNWVYVVLIIFWNLNSRILEIHPHVIRCITRSAHTNMGSTKTSINIFTLLIFNTHVLKINAFKLELHLKLSTAYSIMPNVLDQHVSFIITTIQTTLKKMSWFNLKIIIIVCLTLSIINKIFVTFYMFNFSFKKFHFLNNIW